MTTNIPTSATSLEDAGVDGAKKKNPTSAKPQTMNVMRLLRATQRSKPDIRDQRDPDLWLTAEIWLWRLCALVAGFDVFRRSTCHLWSAFTSGVSIESDATTAMTSVVMLAFAIRIISLLKEMRALTMPNDPSSATDAGKERGRRK